MKSVIPLAVQETYVKHFGDSDWPIVLKKAGLSSNTKYFAHRDTPDSEVVALLQAIMKHKGLTMVQLSDVFGDYWVNDFTTRHYFAFHQRAESARQFLLNMNTVHDKIGSKVAGSKPPRFTFEELANGNLRMGYDSERDLIDLVVGLVKGVGKRFNESITVTKINNRLLELKFDE